MASAILSTIGGYLPGPIPYLLYTPPTRPRTKPRKLGPILPTRPEGLADPRPESLASMPLPVIAAIIQHLHIEDMVHLSRTCWTLRDTIYPYPLAFASICAELVQTEVWELFDDCPTLGIHVRSLAINAGGEPRIPPIADELEEEESDDGDEILFDDPLDNEDLPDGMTYDHACAIRAENALLPALRRMRNLEAFAWVDPVDADDYAPSGELFKTVGTHCPHLRSLTLGLGLPRRPWVKLLSAFSGLEVVRIAGRLTGGQFGGLRKMLVERCPDLVKLDLMMHDKDHAGPDAAGLLNSLVDWPKLKYLSLSGFTFNGPQYIAFLERHPSLEEIHINWPQNATGTAALDLSTLSPSALPNLHYFTFKGILPTNAVHLIGHGRPLRRVGEFRLDTPHQWDRVGTMDRVPFFDKLAECGRELETLNVRLDTAWEWSISRIAGIASASLVWLDLGEPSEPVALAKDFVFPDFPQLRVLLGVYFVEGLIPKSRCRVDVPRDAGRWGRHAVEKPAPTVENGARRDPVAELRAVARACPKLVIVGYADTGFKNLREHTMRGDWEADFRRVLVLCRDRKGALKSWRDDKSLSKRRMPQPAFEPWYEI